MLTTPRSPGKKPAKSKVEKLAPKLAKSAAKNVPKAPPKAQIVVTGATSELREKRVATAAYYIAERRGFAPGQELEDWVAAEALVAQLQEELAT